MSSLDAAGDRYKWIALSNTTLAVLLATLDASITLIAMPDIFRGIHLDPLVPANSAYLLWMILGYLVVSSVLIVSLGRLGDMFGRVRIYNLGFVIYTVASLLLTICWMSGQAGATYLVVFRIVQGVGGACLLANAAAIITDAFPADQRGMALGINDIVGVSGLFVGLVLGGLQAHGVSAAAAHHASQAPPISILFAAFLGYNPVQHLVGSEVLAGLPAHAHAVLTGSGFFPQLISGPFRDGLDIAFTFAIVACLVAAAASLMRGGRYHHAEEATGTDQRATATV